MCLIPVNFLFEMKQNTFIFADNFHRIMTSSSSTPPFNIATIECKVELSNSVKLVTLRQSLIHLNDESEDKYYTPI